MRSSTQWSANWLVLPVLFLGVLLMVMALVVGSAHGLADVFDEEEEGYGYVESVPEAPVGPPITEESEERLEGAILAAMLGAGWGEGELLSEDLQRLRATARSQLEMYEQEIGRATGENAASPQDLERARERLSEAAARLSAFEAAATALEAAMRSLPEAFERIGAAEARR